MPAPLGRGRALNESVGGVHGGFGSNSTINPGLNLSVDDLDEANGTQIGPTELDSFDGSCERLGEAGPTLLDITQDDDTAQTDQYELVGGSETVVSGLADLEAVLEDLVADSDAPLDTERLQHSEQGIEPLGDGLSLFGPERCARMLEPQVPKFFWEDDPFLSSVFCEGPAAPSGFKRPLVDLEVSEAAPVDVWTMLKNPRVSRTVGICEQVIKHVEVTDEIGKRISVISNWSSLVCINLEAFALGDTLRADGRALTHELVTESLTACFAKKATSTLSKRFYALNKFVNFCCRQGLQFFPVKEHIVFTYLQGLVADEKTSASAGRSLLEALRFTQGVLGLQSDMQILGTGRVDGLSVELGRRAGPIQQATPLTVQQVMQLERLVAECDDLKDVVTFGGLLVLLYSCGRFSDGQRAFSIILDTDLAKIDASSLDAQGYVELQVLGHKSARSETLKRMILPLVAPIYSLSNCDWFRSWVHARDVLGLTVNGKLDYPFICRFDPEGKPMAQEITSAEASGLLRHALKIDDQSLAKMRSHSLKCTALSWCCKYGTDLGMRRLLGHHLDPSSISPETYGRDSMAAAVRCLETTLKEIKKGEFRPDETRSGRFVRAAQTDAPVTGSEVAEGDDSDSDYEPSSSDSDDSDEDPFGRPSEASLLWHLVSPGLRPRSVDVPDHFLVYRNVVSGMQHLKPAGSLKFLCGRRVGERYSYYAGKPIGGVAMCDHCVGSKELQ